MRHVGELFKIVMVVTGEGVGGGGGALGVAFSMFGFGWAEERDTIDFFEFHSKSEDKVKNMPSLKNIGSLQRDIEKRTTSDL